VINFFFWVGGGGVGLYQEAKHSSGKRSDDKIMYKLMIKSGRHVYFDIRLIIVLVMNYMTSASR